MSDGRLHTDAAPPAAVVTANGACVDAFTVTLDEVASLEIGTAIVWRGLTAVHGHTWSPSADEAPPDYLITPDPTGTTTALVTDLTAPTPHHLHAATEASLEELLDRAALPYTGTVCQFSTSLEIASDDSDTVEPCVAVWTGPVRDAAGIPADGMSPDLHSGRVRFRGLLSHRVNAIEDAGIDPWERLRLQQLPGPGEWVLQSGAHVSELVHEHTRDVHTLEDVLLWAQGWLHIAYDVDGPVAPTGFSVSAVEPGAPLTVRIW